jgi:hypothetical protein
MRKTNLMAVLMAPVLGLAILGGCATQPNLVEETYGDAVRNMVDAQIYDRAAAENPGDEPVSLDGKKGELVLKKHREDVPAASESREFNNPIMILPPGQ